LRHYVEHLTWGNAIGPNGAPAADSNAWTNDTSVGYWLAGPKSELGNNLASLAATLKPITLPTAFADSERNIIAREYDMRIGGNTEAQAGEAIRRFLYEGTAFALSAMGTKTEIAAFSYEAAKALHRTDYTACQATLLVVGNLTAREARAALPPLPAATCQPHPQEPLLLGPVATRVLRFPDPSTQTTLIWSRVVTLPRAVPYDLLAARLDLLRDQLDTDLPGGLAGPLRFDRPLASSFRIDLSAVDSRHVVIDFTALPDAGVSLASLRKAFEAALSASATTGFPEATYSQVRQRRTDAWPKWRDPEQVAKWMADYALIRLQAGRDPLPPRDLRRIERQLNRKDENALLRDLVAPGRTAIAYIGQPEKFE
jgi:predicted Zn-dependent peptidase